MDHAESQSTHHASSFRTDSLPVSAYLLATKKLTFQGCELVNSSGHLEFLFLDPDGIGPQLEIEFESGATCAAVDFYNAIRRLRKVMDSQKHGSTNGRH